jgi:hypothetical protein
MVQVTVERPTQAGKRPSELEHSVELEAGASLLPALVVEVLFSAGGVMSGGLDVPKWISADPDLRPGGGYRQGAKPIKKRLILDRLPVSVQEAKASAMANPPQARL